MHQVDGSPASSNEVDGSPASRNQVDSLPQIHENSPDLQLAESLPAVTRFMVYCWPTFFSNENCIDFLSSKSI